MDRAPGELLRLAGALALVAAVLAVAFLRARRRRAYEPALPTVPRELQTRAPLTAYYFTSRLCAACQETPGIVREAAPGVPLVALAVHERPDLVRALGVFETPTLLLADADGRIRYARVGNPAVEELRFWVDEALASSPARASPPRAA